MSSTVPAPLATSRSTVRSASLVSALPTFSATTIPTPPGPLTIVIDDDGVVVACGWTADAATLVAKVRTPPHVGPVRARRDLGPISKAVHAYLDGDLIAIDGIEVRQQGAPFMTHAWDILRTVPPGAPVTYSEFAARCGRPAAVRAAASACARNSVALVIPCHRVVQKGGGLGGFGWGLDVKRWLLAHESGETASRG
jgi:methylated-DNA-[protein]-cysteine S-methyltransferase